MKTINPNNIILNNSKLICKGEELKKEFETGLSILSEIVSSTLGPKGRNIGIHKKGSKNPHLTKDGVSIVKELILPNPIQNYALDIAREAIIKTGDEAGDGTTTCTLLTYNIYKNGLLVMKSDPTLSAVKIKEEMVKAGNEIIEKVRNQYLYKLEDSFIKVSDVAKTSANNDEIIGNLINTAIEEVGKEGVITVKPSNSNNDKLEIIEGIQFNTGFISPFFINNVERSLVEFQESDYVGILIYNGKLVSARNSMVFLETMAKLAEKNIPTLLICEGMEGEALSTTIINKGRGTIIPCVVSTPYYGMKRVEFLNDIAIMTGATVITDQHPIMEMKPNDLIDSYLGKCKGVVVSDKQTTIIDGMGNSNLISERIKQLKNKLIEMRKEKESLLNLEEMEKRIAQITGKVAMIHVGGNTEVEMKERKDRIDDAVYAVKAALAEGVIMGGGLPLYKIATKNKSETIGESILTKSIKSPFLQILKNSGESIDDSEIEKWVSNECFNPLTGNIENFIEIGIVDPFKVTKLALMNSIKVAGDLLTTEAVVIDNPTTKEADVMDYISPSMMI